MKRSRPADRATTSKALQEEIRLRNMIAKFKTVNQARTGKAAIPCVGLFWADVKTARIYAETTSLRDAENYVCHRIHGGSHYEAWKRITALNPRWLGQEYEDVPRGRVAYRKAPRNPGFVVYTAPVCNRKRIRDAIVREFSLPAGYVEFDFTDEHYQLFANR